MTETKAPLPAETPGAERRRSRRVNISMPVLVRGRKGGQAFEEEAQTISVNAHGCMVRMVNPVTRSQEITLVNKKTTEALPCTVIFIGQKESGKTEIGIEFVEPSPRFWRIAFPPEDWDPSERKRSAGAQPTAPLPRR